MKEQKKGKAKVTHVAHKRHRALGIYSSTHHRDYCFRQCANYFPVKSEECGD